jgi:protease-4
MLRTARRALALAFWSLFEIVLRSVGRRPAYDILRIEIAGDLEEQPSDYRLPGLSSRTQQDYVNLLAVLRWARRDPRLRGVLVRCGRLNIGWAKVQEIHRSLQALRDAGKTVVVWLPHAGMHEYAVASAANRIVLAPAGTVDIAGLSSEFTFIGDALKKLGVQAEVVQVGKFKAAGETFTRSTLSAPHREMAESLLQDLYEQITEAVARGRDLKGESVRALLDGGPYVARQAEAKGLVDALQYEDEALEALRTQCQAQTPTIETRDYSARGARAAHLDWLRRGGRRVGLLHLNGALKMGEHLSGPEHLSACGADAVCRDLKRLRESDAIAAVVIRMSSPGGSGLASDIIWHEVERTRRCKPVLVSFGDVAASGAYYAAVATRPIFAEEGSLTGSIGVIAGKAVMRDLYNRLGITKELVAGGPGATLYSDYFPLGEEERGRLQAQAESFYSAFLTKVAEGRTLSEESAGAAAEGRVWTGRQARKLGLVDDIGGLERVVQEARVMAKIAADEPVAIDRFPRPRRFLRLALARGRPHTQAASLSGWFEFLASERVWAILPFRLRFF